MSSHPLRVVCTITYQLCISAYRDTDLQSAIINAVRQHPTICSEPLATQLTKLLFEPLTSIQRSASVAPTLVILDALDECGDMKTRRVLVDLISRRFTSLPPPLKFLITSRPEADIERLFREPPKMKRTEVLPSAGTSDVFMFLSQRMSEIRDARHSCGLPPDWPGHPAMLKFSSYMEGVFILASTVVLFIENAFNPENNLDYLLMSKDSPGSSGNRLDGLYTTTLESAGDWEDPVYLQTFCSALGAVVAGQAPMTVSVVDELLGLESSSSTVFSSLRYLLQYRPNQPIRTLHASIAEYLSKHDRCGSRPWFINLSTQHAVLAHCCLRLMKEQLHFDVCSLETSHLLNKNVPNIRQRVQSAIPEPLAYACRHFATHLHLAGVEPAHFEGLAELEHFMQFQLLFWVESLGLLGEVKLAIPAMLVIKQWYQVS